MSRTARRRLVPTRTGGAGSPAGASSSPAGTAPSAATCCATSPPPGRTCCAWTSPPPPRTRSGRRTAAAYARSPATSAHPTWPPLSPPTGRTASSTWPHRSAYPPPPPTPGFDADVNIRGTIAVAEAATAARARLIFAATCAIYGHPHRLPVAEDSPLAPLSPYGLSKAAAVQYLDWFTAHCGLPVTSLVLGNVYGAGAPGAVIDRFVAATAAGVPTVLHGDGTATRDFVHIDDVTEAFLAACTAPPAGRVNIGSGTETSIRDIHALVTGLTGHTIPAQRQHVRDGDIPRMRLNVTRAASVLAWRARTDLAAGVSALAQAALRSATAARRPGLLDAG